MSFKKSEKTIVFIFVLIVISGLSAALISIVNSHTEPKIKEIKNKRMVEAAKMVLPSSKEILKKDVEGFSPTFIAKDGKRVKGYAFIVSSDKGYGGTIKILLGVDKNFKVYNFKVMEHMETPGLGDQADKEFFKAQFVGKSLNNFNFKVKQDGGDVDAITAATITSRAVSEAIRVNLKSFIKAIKGGK